MIAEALKLLFDMGRKDVTPFPVAKDDPRMERYLVSASKVTIEKANPPRNHQVKSLADLIAMAESVCEPQPAAVFYDEEEVVLVLDYNGHRVERATFELSRSDSWIALNRLIFGPWMDGKTLIRILRTDLYRCLPDAVLVDIIRRVKFENGQVTTTESFRGKESLGRETTAKITAVAEIPDRVTLEIPVYSSLGETLRYPLQCSLEIEPTRSDPFQLKPLPDEIERVQQFAVALIGDRLKTQLPEIPAYYGSV